MIAVLAATFLFNAGQGVLRPSLPLYLQRVFAAKYQMVTLIPVVFGAGKWAASLPTGYLLARVGPRPLMGCGLLLIACCDVGSAITSAYAVFLGLRAVAGAGWAMFATVAITMTVGARASERRGRAVSLLFMSETLGLLLGSMAGGWLYQTLGIASPFIVEAACMLAATLTLAGAPFPAAPSRSAGSHGARDRRALRAVLRTPGVLVTGLTSMVLIAVQTGLIVFLFPLYLGNRGRLAPPSVGVLVSLNVLGRLPAVWLGGDVSDRVGRLQALIPGLLAYAASLGTLAFLTHPVWLGLCGVALGGAAGFVTPLPPALIGDLVSTDLHGVAIGWLRMMTDTGQILGPLALGAIADAADLSTAFVAGAALLVAAAWACQRQADVATPASRAA